MEEFIARLLDLQDCDRDVSRSKADLESIPQEMKIHRKDTEGHEEKFDFFNENLESIRKKQKKLSGDRQDNVARIADYKSRLISLKSNTEYTAMLKQITHAEKMNGQIDSMILEAMYEEDEASQALERAMKERDRAVKRSVIREESLVEKLNELDTEAIPPTAQVIELHNVMRDDEPRPSLPTEDVLANAPQREGDRFRVLAILE